MRQQKFVLPLILAIAGVPALALIFAQRSAEQDFSGQDSGRVFLAQSSALLVLNPRAGQALANDSVTVRFELLRPNPAGGVNNFRVRLDDRDAVKTSQTECTFTGLRPGQHTLTVSEVDANGTLLPDATVVVRFSVKAPASTSPPAQSGTSAAQPK